MVSINGSSGDNRCADMYTHTLAHRVMSFLIIIGLFLIIMRNRVIMMLHYG